MRCFTVETSFKKTFCSRLIVSLFFSFLFHLLVWVSHCKAGYKVWQDCKESPSGALWTVQGLGHQESEIPQSPTVLQLSAAAIWSSVYGIQVQNKKVEKLIYTCNHRSY